MFWITGLVFAMHNYTCYLLESNHNYNIHSTYILLITRVGRWYTRLVYF